VAENEAPARRATRTDGQPIPAKAPKIISHPQKFGPMRE